LVLVLFPLGVKRYCHLAFEFVDRLDQHRIARCCLLLPSLIFKAKTGAAQAGQPASQQSRRSDYVGRLRLRGVPGGWWEDLR